MALSKLAIGLIAGVLTVGAIGGITAGIVTSQNRSGDLNIEGNEGDETNGMGDKNPNPSSDASKPEMINLQAILDGIEEKNIVYSPKPAMVSVSKKALTPPNNQQDLKAKVYAFDVKSEELGLDEKTQKNIPQGVKITIELANNTNQGVLLNGGNLPIVIKAKLNDQESETKEKPLQVTGFKQISDVLKKAFAAVAQEADNKAVLDLSKPEKSTETITLTTIEELNKKSTTPKTREVTPAPIAQTTQQVNAISGLTALFQKVKTPNDGDSEYKTVTIKGEVKLAKITKTDSESPNTLFHLVSGTDSPLKLVNNKDTMTTEVALVDEVIVTNLLASNIKLMPVGIEEQDQKAHLEEFKKEENTSKGYKGDETHGYHVEVKTSMSDSAMINIGINPLLIKRTSKEQPIMVNLEIAFGTNEFAKTYKTSDEVDLTELNNAGFSFGIFSKKLESDTNNVPQASAITAEDNMLGSYFVKEGNKTPVMKTMFMDDSNPKGGFSLVPETMKPLTSNIQIGIAKNTKPEGVPSAAADMGHENWLPENWISFVGYTFKGLGESSINENSLLFIPTINLIHIQEPTHAVGTGAGA